MVAVFGEVLSDSRYLGYPKLTQKLHLDITRRSFMLNDDPVGIGGFGSRGQPLRFFCSQGLTYVPTKAILEA